MTAPTAVRRRGFLVLAAAHLATLLNRHYRRYNPVTGHAANLWRFALTTGTGLDLGVIIARDLYASAMYAPLFIAYSLTYGLAVLLVLLPAIAWLGGGRPEQALEHRLGRLLAIFIAVSFYLTLVLHLFNLYAPAGRELTRFLWLEGGFLTALFWGGQVLVGTLLPLILIVRRQVIAAAGCMATGGLATLYVVLIAAQALPQRILPGLDLSSAHGDGAIAAYTATSPEWLLGGGGVAVAMLVLLGGCLALRVAPTPRPHPTTHNITLEVPS